MYYHPYFAEEKHQSLSNLIDAAQRIKSSIGTWTQTASLQSILVYQLTLDGS